MLKIDLEIDTDDFSGHTDAFLARVVQPALAAGVNNAAAFVRADLIQATTGTFDRPMAFTVNAFAVYFADPRDPATPLR